MSRARIRGVVNNTSASRQARRVDHVKDVKRAVNEVEQAQNQEVNASSEIDLDIREVSRPELAGRIARPGLEQQPVRPIDSARNPENGHQTIRTLMVDYITPDLRGSEIFYLNTYESALQNLYSKLQSSEATDVVARKTRRLVKNGLDAISAMRQSSNGLMNG